MKDKLIDKIIRFDLLLGVVALVIALVAAFFSVYGIATLFAGAFLSTAVMGGVLEVGKLVAVTYLFRYWDRTQGWLSTYLSIALVVLMVITSAGIFGYLSAAYEKSSFEYKARQNQIVLVENTKRFSQDKINQAQSRIVMLNEMRKSQESRLSEALTNSLISRNAIALRQIQEQTAEMIKTTESDTKTEQGKIDAAIKEIQDTESKISEMRYSDKNKDIRTFEFVAKLFNSTLDNVAKWFIFLLIVVFDPLAMALILAYNVVTYKKEQMEKTQDIVKESKTNPIEPDTEVIETEPIKKKVNHNRLSRFYYQKIPRSLTFPETAVDNTTTSTSTTTTTTTTTTIPTEIVQLPITTSKTEISSPVPTTIVEKSIPVYPPDDFCKGYFKLY